MSLPFFGYDPASPCYACAMRDRGCPLDSQPPGAICAQRRLIKETTMPDNTIPDTMDRQVGGDHYRSHGRMQPWAIIEHYGLNYWEGCALKYLLRAKDPAKRAEDLRKAAHCLEHQARRVEEGK